MSHASRNASDHGGQPGCRPTNHDPAGPAIRRDRTIQPALPFEEPTGTLGRDNPIGYALTARARRVVAPSTLPRLEVLPGDATEAEAAEGFDPYDTRPARARALRRSGRSLAEIGALLDVDLELVARWCDEVHEVARRASHGRVPTTARRGGPVVDARRAAARQRFTAAAGDPDFRTGLGLVSGLADISPHAVLVATDDLDTAAVVVAWIRCALEPDESRLRLVLEVPADLARDVVIDRWTSRLGIPAAQVTAASSRSVEPGNRPTASLRIADRNVATTLAEWRRALVEDLAGAV